jgi:DNA-binding GntR family transcriptional regulator
MITASNILQTTELSGKVWQGMSREDLVTRVANALRDQIRSGKLARGSRFCGEMELAKQIGVSRPTLREATRILAREGLIEIRHGAGTFVSENYGHVTGSLDSMTSMSSVIREFGAEPQVRALKIRRQGASAQVATALGIVEGTPVAAVERVRLIGNRPLAIAHEYIVLSDPDREFPVVKTFDGNSIYHFLATKLKLQLAHSETSLTAVLADKKQSKLLHLKERHPLLCMREIHFDANGKRKFYSINYHNTTVIDFTLVRLGARS